MDQEVLEIATNAIYVLMKTSAPVLLVALVVGLIISLFQALTQIQEQTLSFVPKIMAIFISLLFLFPYMLGNLQDFFEQVIMHISTK